MALFSPRGSGNPKYPSLRHVERENTYHNNTTSITMWWQLFLLGTVPGTFSVPSAYLVTMDKRVVRR